MKREKRRFSRRAVKVDFHGNSAEGIGELLFEGVDLSAGGTFLRSDLLLEQGERLGLQFGMPGLPRQLHAEAQVAWVRRFPKPTEPAGMGIEFVGMSEEDRSALSHYLSSMGSG